MTPLWFVVDSALCAGCAAAGAPKSATLGASAAKIHLYDIPPSTVRARIGASSPFRRRMRRTAPLDASRFCIRPNVRAETQSTGSLRRPGRVGLVVLDLDAERVRIQASDRLQEAMSG